MCKFFLQSMPVISANANGSNLLIVVSLIFIAFLYVWVLLNSGAKGENQASADVRNFLMVISADVNASNLLTIVSLLFIDVKMIFNGY